MGHLIGGVQVFLCPDDDGIEDGESILALGGEHVFLAGPGTILVRTLSQ